MGSGDIRQDKLAAIKIFLTVFLISAFFFKPNLTFARFEFLTKALAHYNVTWIDKIQEISGLPCMDSLVLNGHTYIEVSPGLSFIGLASYFPYSAFLQAKLIRTFSLDARLEFALSQFVMALSTVTLFTALLIAVFFLSLQKAGCSKEKAIIFSFLLYFGTPIIFYSLNLTNGQNILEAALLFTAFFIIRTSKIENIKPIFLCGLLCGLAIFVNGAALFFLPLFLLIILFTPLDGYFLTGFSRRWQNILPWIIGVILGVIPFLLYNQISFGNLLRTFYNAKYGNYLLLHLKGSFNVARVFLISTMVGLFLFFPLVIILAPMFRKLWSDLIHRFILFTILFYIICISITVNSLNKLFSYDSIWYFNQGGGGPRFLLPVIPFSLYAIATTEFDSEWKKILTSTLMFISVIINAPGLFWTGAAPHFLNNLLLFCKNGFHSYMIDLIRDILIRGGFNINGLSLFPLLAILGIFIWWLWAGGRRAMRPLNNPGGVLK